jgi:hypothetical protein
MPRPRKPKKPPGKIGRPSSYNEGIADRICTYISEGGSLTAFCLQDGVPRKATIMRWLRENALFRDCYARAREDQAEVYADSIAAIADGEGDPNDKRVRIDARKWLASKLAPKKYGDRVLHDATEEAATALSQLELARRLAFIMQAVTRPEAETKLIEAVAVDAS